MRILFLTSYYSPSTRGWGYMQLCEEVADGISGRGHEIAVLTSTQRDGAEPIRSYPVHRLLTIEPDWHSGRLAARQFFVGRRWRERQAVQALQDVVEKLKPDLIFIWHALGLPRVLLQAAEQTAPTVYYLADYLPELPDEYMAYWQAQPVRKYARLIKGPLARVALSMLRREDKPIFLKYEHVICVSGYVRQRLVEQDLIPPTAIVIHNGVDVEAFASARSPRTFDGKLSLICAGRLDPDKGIHHVIEVLGSLSQEQRHGISHLAIVGDGRPAYVDYLRSLVSQRGLSEVVEFAPPVPRDEMPKLLDAYDVLIQPSALEALSRMMQEAMSMGLLVIGTATGGSSELLVHEQTGLVFEAGDPQALAAQLLRAKADPQLAATLADNGRQAVVQDFDIRHTIERVERYLLDLVSGQ